MRTHILLPTVFLYILVASTTNGQIKSNKQLIKNLDRLIAEKFPAISPGCAVLVAKKGQIIYEKGFGTANIELQVPVRPEMIFRIGSITKQYTAIGILRLVEQHKIALSDSIQRFIPGFPTRGYPLTIENLLTHTSGIPGYEQLDANIPNAIRVEFPAGIIIDSLAALPLEFIPSSKYNYSNSNYFLLGYIIEQVSGKTYKNYLQEDVFKPAGLLNTFYDSPTDIIPNRVTGYSKLDSKYRNIDYISMSLVYSAGALASSVSDLFKWHQALHSNKLVRKETLGKALTPFRMSDGAISEYGYGWFIKNWLGKLAIGHGGAIDGFRSSEMYFPEQDIFVAALFNCEADNFFTLFEEITALCIEKDSGAPDKNFKVSDSVLQSYTGIYRPLEDTTEFFRIYKEKNSLYLDLSNGSGRHMPLVAQSETSFHLPIIRRVRTTIEFIVEDGKVRGLYWTQEKKNELRKSE